MLSRPKKSPSSRAHKAGTTHRAIPVATRCVRRRRANIGNLRPAPSFRSGAGTSQRDVPTCRRKFREWRASLPDGLERDALLMPDGIATRVVREAERLRNADLPGDIAGWLAARADSHYPRHKNFHHALNRPDHRGRDNLYPFMRHRTASWPERERYPLYQQHPWSYASELPRPLPG